MREEGGFIFTDRSAVALECMERMHSAGPPLICCLHLQGLGRRKATPKAVQVKAVQVKAVQVKAVKAAPPQAAPPPAAPPPSGTPRPSFEDANGVLQPGPGI